MDGGAAGAPSLSTAAAAGGGGGGADTKGAAKEERSSKLRFSGIEGEKSTGNRPSMLKMGSRMPEELGSKKEEKRD